MASGAMCTSTSQRLEPPGSKCGMMVGLAWCKDVEISTTLLLAIATLFRRSFSSVRRFRRRLRGPALCGSNRLIRRLPSCFRHRPSGPVLAQRPHLLPEGTVGQGLHADRLPVRPHIPRQATADVAGSRDSDYDHDGPAKPAAADHPALGGRGAAEVEVAAAAHVKLPVAQRRRGTPASTLAFVRQRQWRGRTPAVRPASDVSGSRPELAPGRGLRKVRAGGRHRLRKTLRRAGVPRDRMTQRV